MTSALPESAGTPTAPRSENAPAKKKVRVANQSARAARPKPKPAHKATRRTARASGATLEELMKAAGWQPHSVRGFLSGTVSKKMGLRLESFKRDDQRTYRIITK